MTKITDTGKFIRMWNAGKTGAEIGAHFGVRPETVRYNARKLGLPPREPGVRPRPFSEADAEIVRQLWPTDLPIKEIASRVSRKPQTVKRIAERLGLPQRSAVKGTVKAQQEPSQTQQDDAPQPRAARETEDFNAVRDGALVASQGKYAEIRRLADNWNLPVSKVQARWHLVRA